MKISRRATLTSAVGLIMSSVMARASGKIHWAYEGHEGPEHWGELSDDFGVCSFGKQQSPIDLKDAVPADMADIAVNWNPNADWEVVNNGHTIQANPGDGGHAVIEGKKYQLLQFHFHAPSEHTVDGKHFAMEAHFVHKANDGGLAVIGVMISGGGQNALLDSVMAKAPHDHGETALGEADPAGLLPKSQAILRYQGSLTTPPCSQTVLWTIMQEPVKVSDTAIAAFTSIYNMNARPLQGINRRFILTEG